MYEIWMNEIKFPVAPEKITTKVHGNNKTLNLINEAEVNQIKGMKLREFSFELLLPRTKYSFAHYIKNGVEKSFLSPEYYVKNLEKMKKKKTPFEFRVIRKSNQNQLLGDSSMLVTLESYEITEAAEELYDVIVSIELKQYVKFGTKKVKIRRKKIRRSSIDSTKRKKIPSSYQTKKGDTLYSIGKSVYGKSTANNASVLYKKNKKTIDQALGSQYAGKFTKRIYTASLPKGLQLKVPGNVKYTEYVEAMEGVIV